MTIPPRQTSMEGNRSGATYVHDNVSNHVSNNCIFMYISIHVGSINLSMEGGGVNGDMNISQSYMWGRSDEVWVWRDRNILEF